MRIAIDTNILIRLLLEDDQGQLKLVHRLIKRHNEKGAIFISLIVFLELYWVLRKYYQWSDEKICDALEDVLRAQQFHAENDLAVKMAISRCRKNQDFSDALIGQIGASRNLRTYTFDLALKTDHAFVVLV